MSEPKTLLEAVRHFSDLEVCNAYMIALKWPDGAVKCPACGGDKIGLIASRRLLQCKNVECRRQFSAKVGTIFEDSPLGLDKWFVAVWAVANGDEWSTKEFAEIVNVEQKTAWRMLNLIRIASGGFQDSKVEYMPIPGWETYRAGSDGSIWSGLIRGRQTVGKTWRRLCPSIDSHGYLRVTLYSPTGEKKTRKVHRLILETFFGPRPAEDDGCRHLDGDKRNCSISNLCWGTAIENAEDKLKHSTQPLGEKCHLAKYSDAVIEIVRSLKGKQSRGEVAAKFGMIPNYVSRIWSGEI